MTLTSLPTRSSESVYQQLGVIDEPISPKNETTVITISPEPEKKENTLAPGAATTTDVPTDFISRVPGIVWVVVWFFLNVALAILMKIVFSNSSFKFPVLMSTVHMIVSTILSQIVMSTGMIPKQEISEEGTRRLRYFVVLFCLNIAFGNIAVEIVNLALSQLVRSAIPIFIMVIAKLVLNVTPSLSVILSVFPIVIGVGMAAYGDIELTVTSFALLIMGNIFAALKVVVTNKSLTQYKLHPMVMLAQLSPASSVVMFFFAVINGEVSRFALVYRDIDAITYMFVILSGVMAFFLNWTNFLANMHTSPLTMSVLGNVKQALIIVLSLVLFHTHIKILSGVGVTVTMAGMMLYTYLTYIEKQKAAAVKKDSNV
jgi:uncharacterized membrane protein